MLLLLQVEVCIDASYTGLLSCIFTGRERHHRDEAKMQQILQAEKEDNEGNQIAPRKPVRSRRARKKGRQQAPSTRDTDRKDESDDAFTPTLEDCSDDESELDDDEPEIVTNVEVCVLQLAVVSLLIVF